VTETLPLYLLTRRLNLPGLQTALLLAELGSAPPPYDPWADVREAANLLRQPEPDIDAALTLLDGAWECRALITSIEGEK